MRLRSKYYLAAIGVAWLAGTGSAQSIQQANWGPKARGTAVYPPAGPCQTCPPASPYFPRVPGTVVPGMPAPAYPMPTMPGVMPPAPMPGQPMPGQPSGPMPPLPMNPTPGAPNTPPTPNQPNTPPTPNAPQPNQAPQLPSEGATAQAESRGGSLGETSYPTTFGDLFGGGVVAGPIPVTVNAAGNIVGFTPVVVNQRTGVRSTLTTLVPGGPTDELITGRPATGSSSTSSGIGGTAAQTLTQTVVVPRPGTVFVPEQARFTMKIPALNRGTFKLTENDTPRPTDRVYFIYNFYDNLFNNAVPGADRIVAHQETVGVEKAFGDRQFSVGLRLPYNQLVGRSFSDTSLGDLTLISKVVLLEDRETGDILSGGLAITLPTGNVAINSTITGEKIHPTLIQPYLGYIKTVSESAFVQGFTAVVVPTDTSDVTLFTQTFAAGYFLYRNPDGFVSSITPVVESHLNVPLDHRGLNSQPVGFVDTLTVLGGIHTNFGRGTTLGFATGAPVMGPRPFSLQATLSLNVRF